MLLYATIKKMIRVYFFIFYKLNIKGLENVADSHFIVCCNHTSNWDPFFVGSLFSIKLKFMAKEEMFNNYFANKIMRALGAFPVKRGKGDLDAIKQAMCFLRQKESLLIFPEGKRSKSFSLTSGKSGAVSLALKTKTKILPIAVRATYKIFSTVDVRIGAPIDFDEYYSKKIDKEEVRKLTNSVLMPKIASLLES